MATTTKWVIDPGHSKLQFKVRHLAIANVTGSFKTISGVVETTSAAETTSATEPTSAAETAGTVSTAETAGDTFARAQVTFAQAQVTFEMDAASIDTNNSERDNHLKSELFLDVATHPRIVFAGVLTESGGAHELTGNLTLRGITKPVTLQIEHTGTGVGRFNDVRAGFELTGKLNRKDFGLSFNLLNAAGNLVVGEEIKLQGDIQLVREPS